MIKTSFFNSRPLAKGIIALCIICIINGSCNTQPVNIETEISVQNEVKEQPLDWFREAKFGMFIHWGPYSGLAGEWKGQKQTENQAEWIMKYLKIPVNEYREMAHKMNPVIFNAKEWVQLAKATGMKYIVITAKHHDGFAMYHSGVTKYNIVDWTPFGRDPLKELSDACAEEGIKFCVYYSHREDWDHPGGYGNDWDYDNDWGDNLFPQEKFRKYLEEKAKPQLQELLTNYGPIGLVWFDRGMYTQEQGLEFVKLVKDIQPSCLINSRVGNYNQELLGDYQSMSDNGMPPGGIEEYWEAPMTLNRTWGFRKSDTLWKSPETVIQRLVEIVSRGGNYLLNIGPTGEGEIPEATVDIFNKVGPWIKRNTESIYGTTVSPFPEIPWGYATVKGTNVYLFVRDWPKDGVLTLYGMKNSVKSARLLIDKSLTLSFNQTGNTTSFNLPLTPPDKPITVLVLEIEGTPLKYPQIVVQDSNGKLELNYLTAITHGKSVTRFNRKGNFHISKWTGPEDSVDWDIQINKPGISKVNISYAANKEWEGKPFEISAGSSSFKTLVEYTGNLFEYHELPVGYINFAESGNYTLTIRPLSSSDSYLMYLRSINLSPANGIKKGGWGVNKN
jgi:alpha-L-fucosidase